MRNASGNQLTRRALLRRGGFGIAALSSLSGCTSNGSTSTPTSTPEGPVVEVGPGGRYKFVPGTDEPLRISTGTTVKWVWKSDTHNIVVGSQPDGANWEGTPGDASKTYDSGYTYEFTFEIAGTYHYWCQPHKTLGMVADVVVE